MVSTSHPEKPRSALSGLAAIAARSRQDSYDERNSCEPAGPGPGSPLALWLRAARLAAGFVDVDDAIKVLGVPAAEYMDAETGRSTASSELLVRASATYGVLACYIEKGLVLTEREVLAYRIAGSLKAAAAVPFGGDRTRAVRLRQMRERGGFATPEEAAAAFGWDAPTYLAHENGTTPISTDLLIGYALALRARPEYAVSTALPLEPPAGKRVQWWRYQRPENLQPHDPFRSDTDWKWLRQIDPTKGTLKFALVEPYAGRFAISKRTLVLPRMLLPGGAAAAGATLYGFIGRFDSGTKIAIVDPSRAVGKVLQISKKYVWGPMPKIAQECSPPERLCIAR